MKFISLLTVTFGIAFIAKAQISLEKSYSNVLYMPAIHAKLDGDGDKYAFFDTLSKTIKVYNTDHSLWKTIPTTQTNIQGFAHLSTRLFNNDPKVEVLVISVAWNATHTNWNYIGSVVNENGNVLATIPNCWTTTVSKVGSDWKLFARDFSTYESSIWSLPGSLPEPSGLKPEPRTEGQTALYPNPMSDAATIEYLLPNGMHEGTIDIYSASGQKVKSYTVTDAYRTIVIERGALPAGNYIYKVAGGGASQFAIR